MAIVVMGVSGSGKSTLGALLAQTLGCAFLEGDDFHDAVAVAMMRGGEPLTDAERWPWLDRIGAALAREVSTRGLAVAACSALRRAYRERLAAAAGAPIRFVLLDNDPDELLRRLNNRPGHYMPPGLLASQLATLERPDADEPAVALDSHDTPAELRDETLAWLAQPVLS
ncbi:MAG: gluconokinase [Sphingomonas sp.]